MCSGRILVYVTETPPKQQVGFGVEIPWFPSVEKVFNRTVTSWFLGGGFKYFVMFIMFLPYLGKIPMLTHVFCVCKQICFKK